MGLFKFINTKLDKLGDDIENGIEKKKVEWFEARKKRNQEYIDKAKAEVEAEKQREEKLKKARENCTKPIARTSPYDIGGVYSEPMFFCKILPTTCNYGSIPSHPLKSTSASFLLTFADKWGGKIITDPLTCEKIIINKNGIKLRISEYQYMTEEQLDSVIIDHITNIKPKKPKPLENESDHE